MSAFRIKKEWQSWPVHGPAMSECGWRYIPQEFRRPWFSRYSCWRDMVSRRGFDSQEEAENHIRCSVANREPQHPTQYINVIP